MPPENTDALGQLVNVAQQLVEGDEETLIRQWIRRNGFNDLLALAGC